MDLSQHQAPNPATRAYIEFLHSVTQDASQVGGVRCCPTAAAEGCGRVRRVRCCPAQLTPASPPPPGPRPAPRRAWLASLRPWCPACGCTPSWAASWRGPTLCRTTSTRVRLRGRLCLCAAVGLLRGMVPVPVPRRSPSCILGAFGGDPTLGRRRRRWRRLPSLHPALRPTSPHHTATNPQSGSAPTPRQSTCACQPRRRRC